MAAPGATIRQLWRPRAIASVAIPLLVVLIIAVGDKQLARTILAKSAWRDAVHYALVFVAALIAAYTVRAFTYVMSRVLDIYVGLARARSLGTLVSVVLYCVVILMAMNAAGLNLNGLLVGGALTGVIVGIAGQASLSNIIAGLVILFARPYSDGTYLTARAGAFGGVEYSGRVWYVSLFHTILHSGDQEIRIPNSVMISAVVVLRPQELDVYIPIMLPRTTDLPPLLERLRREITACANTPLAPHVTLESITDAGYIVGVRVFVSGEAERRKVEQVVARLSRAAPDPAPLGRDGDLVAGPAEWEGAVE